MEGESTACPFCKGTGRCGGCDGKGEREHRKRWFKSKRTDLCGACHGSGKCELCQGQGKRPTRERFD